MKQSSNAKKLSTEVRGLDSLLHGGIQLQEGIDNHVPADRRRGLVIMIRGSRSSNKTLLAVQLMHGLTKSLYKLGADRQILPEFYSLNKSRADLSDMYLDMLITRQIDRMIRENISGESQWTSDVMAKCLFDLSGNSELQRHERAIELPHDYRVNIDKYLCERDIYYNTRTNSLHFRHSYPNDDYDNILFYRRSDNISEYCGGALDPLPERYREDFICIDFSDMETASEDRRSAYCYSRTPMQRYQDIVDKLIEPVSKEDAACAPYKPSIVIDGFSQFTTEELRTISFDHLEKSLRRAARISILVFDDRDVDMHCNADIVIDIRRKEDPKDKYTYYELLISKSVFQTVAFGWHQYKKRDFGIEVFPSLHLMLTKRSYLPHVLISTHKGILSETFEQYLNEIGRMGPAACRGGERTSAFDPSYESYRSSKTEREMNLLHEMLRRNLICSEPEGSEEAGNPGWIEWDPDCDTDEARRSYPSPNRFVRMISELSNVLLNCPGETFPRWKEHEYTTALIGNPNSYKRLLAMASAFHAARHCEHTLVILFDKEESDMRRQMVCPGIRYLYEDYAGDTAGAAASELQDMMTRIKAQERIVPCMEGEAYRTRHKERDSDRPACAEELWTCGNCSKRCKLRDQCSECYRYIHFFKIRMGCISADEFFAVLQQQIDSSFMGGKKCRHIIIDDLQKIDYSFPFLKNTPLFLSAMISFCRKQNLEVKILCDKRASLTEELCSLADNVICIHRDETDRDSMDLYLERNANHVMPSEVLKYRIDRVRNLFLCTHEDIRLNYSPKAASNCAKIRISRIGSMKEYWRSSGNVYVQGRVAVENRAEE